MKKTGVGYYCSSPNGRVWVDNRGTF